MKRKQMLEFSIGPSQVVDQYIQKEKKNAKFSIGPSQAKLILVDRDSYIKGDLIFFQKNNNNNKTYEWLNDNVVKSHTKKNE